MISYKTVFTSLLFYILDTSFVYATCDAQLNGEWGYAILESKKNYKNNYTFYCNGNYSLPKNPAHCEIIDGVETIKNDTQCVQKCRGFHDYYGRYEVTNGGEENSYVKYVCNEGYSKPQMTSKCIYKNGELQWDVMPTCVKNCQNEFNGPWGRSFAKNNGVLNEHLTFECNDGFSIPFSDAKCVYDYRGQLVWVNKTECIKNCDRQMYGAWGTATAKNNGEVLDTLIPKCNPGFSNPQTFPMCIFEDGKLKWVGKTCVPNCKVFIYSNWGQAKAINGGVLNDKLNLICRKGYSPPKEDIICSYNVHGLLNWNRRPKCVENCKGLSGIWGKAYPRNGGIYNDTLYFKCSLGYQSRDITKCKYDDQGNLKWFGKTKCEHDLDNSASKLFSVFKFSVIFMFLCVK